MTVDSFIALLSSLNQSARLKTIAFCHNPSVEVCDEFVPEYETSCCITKKDVTIYIRKTGARSEVRGDDLYGLRRRVTDLEFALAPVKELVVDDCTSDLSMQMAIHEAKRRMESAGL